MPPKVRFAIDSALEREGFEPSVPGVMDGDTGQQVPALIAVFELAGMAVALQRGTKVVWPDRHPDEDLGHVAHPLSLMPAQARGTLSSLSLR